MLSQRKTFVVSHNSVVAVTIGTTVTVAVAFFLAISRNVFVTVTRFFAGVSGCGARKS